MATCCLPRPRDVSIHCLVLEAFIGPRPDGHQASHLDGDRTNNRLDNMRWETRSQNNRRKYQHGTMPVGDRHFPELTNELQARPHLHGREHDPHAIRARQCRAWGYRRFREYLARRRAAEAAERHAAVGGP